MSKDALCLHDIDPNSIDIHGISNDALGPLIAYGKHLFHLGKSRELVILNGLHCFPDSSKFMCFPHRWGASVVDYVQANQDLLPYIQCFFNTPIPLAYESLLSFSLKASQPLPPSPLSPPCTPRITLLFEDED
jgi:hypothetical protein